MNSGNSFIQTLKRLGYNEADFLDDLDFNSIVSGKELESFFEVFCMLTEKNVLTTEEIKEYVALTAAELAEIEVFRKNENFEDINIQYEKEKVPLLSQLSHIENHNKSIERQMETFKKHEEDLLEEKEIQQNLLLNAKKMFQVYEKGEIPQAEKEFTSCLKPILEVVEDLEFLIAQSDVSENKLPTSGFFMHIVQQYLLAEEKILQCVTTYLQNNFQQKEDGNLSVIVDENLCREELEKEASFLKKMLKRNMGQKVTCEKEVKKIESMIKYIETVNTSDLICYSSQLRYHLDDALKINEQLKKKEKELEAFLHDAVCKHVDTLCTEIGVCENNETYNNFQFFIEKIFLPMDILKHQRARVEMLNAMLSDHKKELHNLKKLIERVLNQMKQELSCLEQRKILMKNEIDHIPQKKNEQCLETRIFSSLCKILDDSESSDDSKVSIKDAVNAVQKASKLFEVEEDLKKKRDKKIETIDLLEKYAHSAESLLNCTDKKYSNWHELEQTMNTSLNNLVMKLASLEEGLAECNRDWTQRQKHLERQGNLRLMRNLYVYALTNKELFKKCIDDIKVAVEYSEN